MCNFKQGYAMLTENVNRSIKMVLLTEKEENRQ